MHKGKAFLLLGCSSVLLATGSGVLAASLLPTKSYDYYQLNGGSDIAMPPVSPRTRIFVGGNVRSDLGYTCNGFNPAVSITNTINHIGQSIEGLSRNVIASATSAIGALPMYELEKMDPKLYNLIQNAMAGAQDQFNISMHSCQYALSQIKNGKSPYQDWFSISDSNGWMHHAKAAAQGQDVDINAAKTDTTKKGSRYGVQWVHSGASGGSLGNQVPIKILSDVAIAGYNILIDPKRPLDAVSAPTEVGHSGITTFWATPVAAGKFATLVLGNITISTTKSDRVQGTIAGVGLVPIVTACPAAAGTENTCVKTIRESLLRIVASKGTPTPRDLERVSAKDLVVTARVIRGLRNFDNVTQALYIQRIAQDIAIQNIVEEALMLRRVLIAGSQAQVVQNLQPALRTVHASIKRLNKDIENILFEHRIRKQMTSRTLRTLLEHLKSSEENAAAQSHPRAALPVLYQGSVYKKKAG